MSYYQLNDIGYSHAQDIVDRINREGGKAWIGDTWMDYGAGIKWETILYHHKGLDMTVQALNPRDFDEINNGTISESRIDEIVNSATKE